MTDIPNFVSLALFERQELLMARRALDFAYAQEEDRLSCELRPQLSDALEAEPPESVVFLHGEEAIVVAAALLRFIDPCPGTPVSESASRRQETGVDMPYYVFYTPSGRYERKLSAKIMGIEIDPDTLVMDIAEIDPDQEF